MIIIALYQSEFYGRVTTWNSLFMKAYLDFENKTPQNHTQHTFRLYETRT